MATKTTKETTEDLAYIRQVSEAASGAPLLGGRFLVFWGSLVAAAWAAQWAILSGAAGLGVQALGPMWLAFGVIGGLGQFALVRSAARKPGQGTTGNRVSTAVWTAGGFALFSYAGAMIAAAALGRADQAMLDTILAVAFAVYAMAFVATAAASGAAWLRGFAALSFAGAGTVPFFLGEPVLYLISAVVVFLVAAVPGVILLKREPASLPSNLSSGVATA